MGRVFGPGDETACSHCVVITYRLWAEEFHKDQKIVGKTILVDNRERTVIGVLPRNFSFIFPEAAVWLAPYWDVYTRSFADRLGAVLRLKSGVTLAQTEKEFRPLVQHDGYDKAQMESFSSRAHQGTKVYLFFTILSLFGGIALGSSRLG